MNRAIVQKLLQPNFIIAATLVIAVIVVAVSFAVASIKPAAAYVTPSSGEIVQEVDTTGTVTAADAIDLSFQTNGQIAYVGPAVGAHVVAGTTLASLSGADLRAQLEQARAGLAAQQAQLANLTAGATPQNVALSQTNVTNAQNALTQSKQAVLQAARDAYLKSDDAVHNKVDQIFSNPRSSSPTLLVTSNNSQLTVSLTSERITMEQVLASWQTSIAALPSDPNSIDINALESQTSNSLSQTSAFLDQASAVLSSATPSNSVNSSALLALQTTVATGRANVSAAVSGLNTAETAETAAASALATAQSQLTVTSAPPTTNAVDAQQAAVAAAQANVDLAQAQLSKTYIVAPIAGTITVNNAHLGATASVGSPIISMISDTKFQMDTYVSEADVAKIKTGDVASVSLDAFQSQAPFAAHVIAIDPAATVNNGISSYKVTLQFDDNDARIQAGMTGSAHITTAADENALSVPTSAIITRGTSTFVIARSADGTDAEVPVTTGINSSTGMTEILSGLDASQKVRTFGTAQ